MNMRSPQSIRIVFLGKPGSGKGTQAALLSERLMVPHLSSGAILREEIRERTPFGRKVEEYVLRGEIGPEELITTVILRYIERRRYTDGYILDGFPRTMYQARELDVRYPPGRCILLSVHDETVLERLASRLTCRECGEIHHEIDNPPRPDGACDRCGGVLEARADDDREAIRTRLTVFGADVEPVIRYYRRRRRLVEIDGALKPDEIHARIMHFVT